jgi:hypothetical protein
MRNKPCLLSALLILSCILGLLEAASAQTNASNQPPDVVALVNNLADADEIERGSIMDQLEQIKDPDVLVPPVLAALDKVDPRDAWKLLDVLARFTDSVKPEPLIRLARRSDPPPPTLEPQLIAMGDRARAPLLKAIDDACVTWKPAPPMSNSEADGEDTGSQNQAEHLQNFLNWASSALADMGSAGLNDLLQMFRGRNACQQNAAQYALTQYALGVAPTLDPHVVRGLSDALAAADPAVQKAAVAVVETMIGFGRATLSAEMIKSLFAILKTHPDAEARRAAFSLLRRAKGDTRRRAAEIASHDTDESIQNAATDFLENLPRPH